MWNAETAARYRGGDNSTLKGARKTARDINALDQRHAVELRKRDNATTKKQQYMDKRDRAAAKGNDKKASKYAEKQLAAASKANAHANAATKIGQQQHELLKNLKSNPNLNVRVNDIQRSAVTKGEMYAMAAISGALVGPVGGAIATGYAYSPANTRPGISVSVKRK